jgi:RNA polymerase sigma factor (TIGR02999 family)
MSHDGRDEFTRLVRQANSSGNAAALIEAVYTELRAIARWRLASERAGHTLQATALVNEVCLRLLGADAVSWNDRAHFFAAAADAMRRILLEHARNRGRQKRGGGRKRLSLDAMDLVVDQDHHDVLALDEAIGRLEQQDPRLGQLVKLRFFAGLSVQETARALGLSEKTVQRDWKLARAWLSRELSGSDEDT